MHEFSNPRWASDRQSVPAGLQVVNLCRLLGLKYDRPVTLEDWAAFICLATGVGVDLTVQRAVRGLVVTIGDEARSYPHHAFRLLIHTVDRIRSQGCEPVIFRMENGPSNEYRFHVGRGD